MQEANRKRMVDLFRAGADNATIAEVIGASIRTVQRTRIKWSKGEDLSHKSPGAPPNKVCMENFVEAVKEEFKVNPTKSMNKLAAESSVSRRTIGRVVHDDLGLRSFSRVQKHLLTSRQKDIRLERSKKLLNWLKSNASTVKIFSDKKVFTVDMAFNSRNDRFVTKNKSDVIPVMRTKHPASTMALGIIASNGKKMPVHFFPQGMRVGAAEYLDVLQTKIKPWIESEFAGVDYVFQQDSAPAHGAKTVQEWMGQNLQFWPKELWPSSSPDLNPLDFAVWGVMDARARATSHANVNSLKASIEEAWDEMSPDFIIKSCRSFRPRLEAVIAVKGGHIE